MQKYSILQRIKKQSRAFTLVEIVVVIAVIGILATIGIIGFGSWRERTALTEVESAASGVKAAMEEARNRNNSYPVFYIGTEFDGTNDTKELFTQSENIRITYERGTGQGYCVDVRSKVAPTVGMFIETSGSSATPRKGTCDGGVDSIPPQPGETVFVFDTTAPGCTGTVQLPVSRPTSGGTIDWGDGSTETRTSPLQSHAYSTPGVYLVKYKGPIEVANHFDNTASPAVTVDFTNAKCLAKVTQWGNNTSPTTVGFGRASNLVYVAEPPHTVTNMRSMFYFTDVFQQPIGHWDVSNVTNMENMFMYSKFNQPLGDWDVSNVTNMAGMFSSVYNQPLDDWDVSNVTNMKSMFQGGLYNHPLNSWDVSNVTNMSMMFAYSDFNHPLSNWNTSNVTNMSVMFYDAEFNQDISGWNTANVTNMSFMFYGATSFNQNISGWNVAKVTTKTNFHLNSPLTQPNCPPPLWHGS